MDGSRVCPGNPHNKGTVLREAAGGRGRKWRTSETMHTQNMRGGRTRTGLSCLSQTIHQQGHPHWAYAPRDRRACYPTRARRVIFSVLSGPQLTQRLKNGTTKLCIELCKQVIMNSVYMHGLYKIIILDTSFLDCPSCTAAVDTFCFFAPD